MQANIFFFLGQKLFSHRSLVSKTKKGRKEERRKKEKKREKEEKHNQKANTPLPKKLFSKSFIVKTKVETRTVSISIPDNT